MESELVRQAEILFGETMTRQQGRAKDVQDHDSSQEAAETDGKVADDTAAESVPGSLTLKMTSRQQKRLWRHVESIENFWENLNDIEPGVVARLAAIASERRWEIIFLTKRSETAGATAQVQSQRWLQSKGFTLPSVYVVQGSRGRIAAALRLDVVIDDRPENCLDIVVDSKARAILVWRDEEKQVPAAANRLGIGVVKSVDKCLNILIQIDSPAPEKPGMIDRARQLLGLKQPTGV